jgi:hypothetical protein
MPSSVRPEPVEGPHFFFCVAAKKEQGLAKASFAADKLSPNGDWQ